MHLHSDIRELIFHRSARRGRRWKSLETTKFGLLVNVHVGCYTLVLRSYSCTAATRHLVTCRSRASADGSGAASSIVRAGWARLLAGSGFLSRPGYFFKNGVPQLAPRRRGRGGFRRWAVGQRTRPGALRFDPTSDCARCAAGPPGVTAPAAAPNPPPPSVDTHTHTQYQ